MDRTVAPGDDFYRYANGAWHDAAQIPADASRVWVFGALRNTADERVRALVEEAAASPGPAGSNRQKIGDYFGSLMNEAAIEALGVSPLRSGLRRIADADTQVEVAQALAWMSSFQATTPFSLGVGKNRRGGGENVIVLAQSGLALPTAYYGSSDPAFQAVADKYVAYAAEILRQLALPGAEARAAKIYDFERRLAAAHLSQADTRNPDLTYRNWTRAELSRQAPEFAWEAYLAEAGVSDQRVFTIAHPEAVAAIARMVAAEPRPVLQDYMRLRYVGRFADVLPKAFRDEKFKFFGAVLNGLEQPQPRHAQVKPLLDADLGEAVGELYVESYVRPETERQAAELVTNLREALRRRLEAADWMTAVTKRSALSKLAAMRAKLLHPEKWRDYSGLVIVRSDAFGNFLRASQHRHQHALSKLGKPVDRSEWLALPYEVTAYNVPSRNVLGFPAALFDAPFFDPAADPAVNYGAVGAFVGHEMTHGFDDEGRKYDESGTPRDWWVPEDAERYKARVEPLVEQFAAFEPLPGLHVNGRASLGENIADLAGLRIAYDAYKLSLDGKPAPVIDGLGGDQRFFLAFAQVWRAKFREEALRRRLVDDVHTPTHYRAYTVRNMDEWYAAFSVQPSDRLYLPPERRVRLW